MVNQSGRTDWDWQPDQDWQTDQSKRNLRLERSPVFNIWRGVNTPSCPATVLYVNPMRLYYSQYRDPKQTQEGGIRQAAQVHQTRAGKPTKTNYMNIHEGGIWKITAVKSGVSRSSVSSKDARQRLELELKAYSLEWGNPCFATPA